MDFLVVFFVIVIVALFVYLIIMSFIDERKKGKIEIKLVTEHQKPNITRAMLFTDLEVGNLFRDPVNENIYMYISPINTKFGCFNAVDIQTGELIYFENEHHIEKIQKSDQIKY